MNRCLNCNEPIKEDKVFCDDLCMHGYKTQQYHKLTPEKDDDFPND